MKRERGGKTVTIILSLSLSPVFLEVVLLLLPIAPTDDVLIMKESVNAQLERL